MKSRFSLNCGIILFTMFIFACSESESSADPMKDYFDNQSLANSKDVSSSSFSGLNRDSIVTGEFKDARDDRTYKMVKIGNQTWMAENLKYIPKEPDENWCYKNDNSNCEKYGRLYRWMTAVGKSEEECGYQKACPLTYPVQGICPEGWHIPQKKELETLVDNAGGQSIAGARLKAKESWSQAWNECIGTDDYQFSAMGTGYLRWYSDNYYNKGLTTGIWSATELEDSLSREGFEHVGVYILFLYNDKDSAQVDETNRDFAESIRCIKDDF